MDGSVTWYSRLMVLPVVSMGVPLIVQSGRLDAQLHMIVDVLRGRCPSATLRHTRAIERPFIQ